MVKGKQEIVELDWKEHSSYLTEGEAKTKSNRLMMFIGKPTIVRQMQDGKWWILVGYNPVVRKINKELF